MPSSPPKKVRRSTFDVSGHDLDLLFHWTENLEPFYSQTKALERRTSNPEPRTLFHSWYVTNPASLLNPESRMTPTTPTTRMAKITPLISRLFHSIQLK